MSREVTKEAELSIGEVAEASGLPATTIRFYEKIGVLRPPQRATNGYRVYGQEDIRRLRFVRNARSLEFTTEEVREVLALREQGQAPCQHVIHLLKEKGAEVNRRIRELEELEQELRALLAAAEPLPLDDIEMDSCVCSLIHRKEG